MKYGANIIIFTEILLFRVVLELVLIISNLQSPRVRHYPMHRKFRVRVHASHRTVAQVACRRPLSA